MTAALALLRYWREGLCAVLALLLGAQTLRLSSANHTIERRDATIAAERASSRLFAERVRATAEALRARAAERNVRIEHEQNRISNEVSHDYETRLADLRRRYDAERLRPNSARGTNPGSGGNPVPGSPGSASIPDGATASGTIDGFACEANSLQLGALQDWVRQVLGQ